MVLVSTCPGQGLMEQVTGLDRKPDSDFQGQVQAFVTIFSLEG